MRAARCYIGFSVIVTAGVTGALHVHVPVSVTAFLTAFAAFAVFVGALALGVRRLPIAALHMLLAAFAVSEGVLWAFAAQRVEPLLQPAALVVALGAVALLGVYAAARIDDLRVLVLSLNPPILAANPRRGSRPSADRRLPEDTTLWVRRRSTLDRAHDRDSSTIIGRIRLRPVPDDTARRAQILCAVRPYVDLANLVADALRALRSWTTDLAWSSFDPIWLVIRVVHSVLRLVGRSVRSIVEGLLDAVAW